MLSEAGCRKRIDDLIGRLGPKIEFVIISDPKHIHYLARFFPSPIGLSYPSSSSLVVERSGRATLLTDNWLHGEASGSTADDVRVNPWYGFTSVPQDRVEANVDFLLQFLRDRNYRSRRIGVEPASMPEKTMAALKKEFPGSVFEDVSGILANMRLKKDEDEISSLREALEISHVAQETARQVAAPGMTELELYGAIYAACLGVAGEPFALITDILSGERGGKLIGGPPTSRVMREGDLVILDTYPMLGGYRSDIASTLVIGGSPTPRQRECHAAALAALEAGEKLLRPGTRTADVYYAMHRTMTDAALGEAFRHHGGHGLGLGHPEPPYLVAKSPEALTAGNVITLEPGINIEGFGGMRLEDNYLITPEGFERLSSHRKDL